VSGAALTTEQLRNAVRRIQASVPDIRDTLNAADRRLGDGDTGMTIEQVVGRWHALRTSTGYVAQDAGAGDIGEALVALSRETARATGSSLGSVLAIGLGAAGRAVRGRVSLDRAGLVTALAAARDAIVARSGAAIGDKSLLDSIARIEQSLAAATDEADLHQVSLRAAEEALAEFRARESRIGRARMYGAKSVGFDDPGMLAAALLLRAAGSAAP
jgi:phosphoenolpyruvate---glycerone phosphotransferase subunit DhaL